MSPPDQEALGFVQRQIGVPWSVVDREVSTEKVSRSARERRARFMHTVWKGSIAFGMVSIPIRLVSATEEKDIQLRQVHEKDGGRIKYKRTCSIDGEEVPYGNIAKGYEVAEGEMVVLKDQDLADLPIASAKTVEVLSFAEAEEINPIGLVACLLRRPHRRRKALRSASRHP